MSDLKRLDAIRGTKAVMSPPRMPMPCPRACSVCGQSILPLLLPTGRYIDRTCQCERDLKHRQEAERERAERHQKMQERTYGWLDDTSDMRLASARFDQLKLSKQPHKEDADRLSFAIGQAQSFIKRPQGVFMLYGSGGLAKTHILASLCNALRERDIPSLFATPPKFFNAFYDRMDHHGNEWELVKFAILTPFLVFDDITKATPKPFRQETFFQIIDERMKAGRPIGITANEIKELATYIGDYAYSRLMVGCRPIMLTGKDCRSQLLGGK